MRPHTRTSLIVGAPFAWLAQRGPRSELTRSCGSHVGYACVQTPMERPVSAADPSIHVPGHPESCLN